MIITTIYLYSESLPVEKELRCINCGRLLLKINRQILAILNSGGMPVREIPVGVGYVEAKCRGCENAYRIFYT